MADKIRVNYPALEDMAKHCQMVAERLNQTAALAQKIAGQMQNGALVGELVTYAPYLKKPKYELAQVQQVLRPSFARTEPRCRHYGICGGCSIQHLDARAQVAVK